MPNPVRTFTLIVLLSLVGSVHATVYNATNAVADQWHSSFTSTADNHALWLPRLLAGSDWLIDSRDPGIFDYDETAGKASFTGSVFNEEDPDSTADFSFNFVRNNAGGTPTLELLTEAYDPPPAGAGIDIDTWTFFDFDGPGSLTGTGGEIAGLSFVLTQRGDGGVRGQLGEGANGKNISFGFSAWLFWSLVSENEIAPESFGPAPVVCPRTNGACSGEGDINIDLAPVPLPATFWLFGTALIGFIGLSRRRSI